MRSWPKWQVSENGVGSSLFPFRKSKCTDDFYEDAPGRGLYDRYPKTRGRERFLCKSLLPGRIPRTWINPNVAQCNISYNERRGTLRGMHFQSPPHQEAKVVQCIQGSIYDIIIDLRPDSATYKSYAGIALTSREHNMLYVPEGFAHGFITLEDQTEIYYLMSEFYAPTSSRGFRWNDPIFNILWPELPTVISERDANYADFSPDLLK